MTSDGDEKNKTVVFPEHGANEDKDTSKLDKAAAAHLLPQPAGGTQVSQSPAPVSGIPGRIQFLVRESGVIVEREVEKVLIIGRRNSSVPVDIDLADYNAQDLGISRNHLKIEIINRRLTIRDLESVNGTLLNGKRMKPHQPYELKHGDELKPGRMHLKVYFIP